MNRVTTQDRARILNVLTEGAGVNAACRITGASKSTVLKLIACVFQAIPGSISDRSRATFQLMPGSISKQAGQDFKRISGSVSN